MKAAAAWLDLKLRKRLTEDYTHFLSHLINTTVYL